MKEFDFLSHKKIRDRLYVVREQFGKDSGSGFNIYVVVGDKKVGVFDTGLGVTSGLRRYIETFITDRSPMIAYLTHVDLDHSGGAILFDEAYMSGRDMPELEWNLNVERRFSDLSIFCDEDKEVLGFCKDHYLHNEDVEIREINDGDVIDLGGIQFEVISLPGHSPGSLVFYNRKDNYVLTGDAIGSISFQRQRDLRESLQYYERFINMMPKDVAFYSGHSLKTYGLQKAKDVRGALVEILDGRNENDWEPTVKYKMIDPKQLNYDIWRHTYESVSVSYDANTLKNRN